MTVKESLLAIKNMLTLSFADATAPVEAATSGKLSDGTVVEYSKLDAGGDLTILAVDGTKQPAPVGQYEMEDGTILSVTEPGKIATVTPSGSNPADEQMSNAPEVAALKEEFTTQMAAHLAVINAQAALITELKTELTTFKAATGKLLGTFSDSLELIASQETGLAAGKIKETVLSQKAQDKQGAKVKVNNAFAKFAEALKEKKNN
jgi:hypothetical protein